MPVHNPGDDDRTLGRSVESARRMSCSPLLYVGAVTVVFANEVVERIVAWGLLTETWATVALLPITLALLYAQLLTLAYYRRDGDETRR